MASLLQVEKQPSSMSTDEAYETLGLKTGEPHEESKIRKAYFKMAQKYHPDKNPDGREIFEAVNKVRLALVKFCSKLLFALQMMIHIARKCAGLVFVLIPLFPFPSSVISSR